jgi:hypothetical protein
MAWIVVTLPFSGLSIASGKRKLYEVKEWWEENEEREREKGTVLVTRKKREIMVVTSQNHVCFLNHTLCVLIPFERSLFRHSFCIILSYNFIIHTLEYNSSPYHNKPNIKTCYCDFILFFYSWKKMFKYCEWCCFFQVCIKKALEKWLVFKLIHVLIFDTH